LRKAFGIAEALINTYVTGATNALRNYHSRQTSRRLLPLLRTAWRALPQLKGVNANGGANSASGGGPPVALRPLRRLRLWTL
jgi:hypothetical protein